MHLGIDLDQFVQENKGERPITVRRRLREGDEEAAAGRGVAVFASATFVLAICEHVSEDEGATAADNAGEARAKG